MPFPAVKLKPGPTRLSAALFQAGFSDLKALPPVTDQAGVSWAKPTELQTALAIVGGESSGHAWCWNINTDGSADYGILEINDKAHPEYFGPQKSPTQLSVWNYYDNAKMARAIYLTAGSRFTPWNAFSNGGYLAVRYAGRSWMDWAQHGVNTMWGTYNSVRANNPSWTSAQVMDFVASTDSDPLKYWS